MPKPNSRRKLLFGKSILLVTISTVVITVLLVFFTGLPSHRTLLENTTISLTILGVAFFIFLVTGLYNGLDVYDNLSHKLKFKWKRSSVTENLTVMPDSSGFPDVGEGIAGILVSIVLWILLTIALVLFLLFMEFVIGAAVVAFIASIYWVMMRALKLIFSKSSECQDDLPKSMYYSFGYTMLYIGWMYGVVYLSAIF